MNRQYIRLVGPVVCALVIAVAVIGLPTATGMTLVVTDADTGDRLLEVPVDAGEEVTLSYTHSVEKTPVEDIYVVDGTELRMDRMVFHSHGAGLPSDAAIERTEEGFVVTSNESYEQLRVVPGSIAGHELVVGDERYDLVERADGPIVISVDDRSIGDVLPALAADRSPDETHSI